MEFVYSEQILQDQIVNHYTALVQHELEIKDSIWNPFDNLTDLKKYIQVSFTNHQIYKIKGEKALYRDEFEIDNEMQIQKRIRYSFWMALGDIGGFHDGLFLMLSFFMGPFASTLFENDLMRGNL